jgi:homopolymeric O-antigen transport system permease protein
MTGRNATPNSPLTYVIERRSATRLLDLAELWRYRELLFFLAWKDVKIRYKQAVLGAAWAVLQPVLTVAAFSIIFGRFAGLSAATGDVPYPLYVLAGLLPWLLFASTVSSASQSLVGNVDLVTKVYFPRLIIPLGAVGASLVDFGVASGALLGLAAFYGVSPSLHILLAPVFVGVTLLAAAGVGTLVSALNVAYRDFKYVVPFALQFWLFVTPIIYPVSIVPERYRWLLVLNPVMGSIEAFRACVVGTSLNLTTAAASLLASLAVFLAGTTYFATVERRFADVI